MKNREENPSFRLYTVPGTKPGFLEDGRIGAYGRHYWGAREWRNLAWMALSDYDNVSYLRAAAREACS